MADREAESNDMSGVHKTFLKRAVASQRLRGVVVDYEVLCKSTVSDAHAAAVPSNQAAVATAASEATETVKRGSIFQNVRGLLQNMTNSETEQGRRVQTTLAGLPSFMRDKILGDDPKKLDDAEDDPIDLEKLLSQHEQPKASTKAVKTVDVFQTEETADGIRAKYLAKMNALKQRAKLKVHSGDDEAILPAAAILTEQTNATDDAGTAKSNLPTRKVNEGTNAFLSYISLRGLSLGVIPPTSPDRQMEFQRFATEVQYLDAVMDEADVATFPQPTPIKSICQKLDLEPKDIVVITSSAAAISSGKSAGAYTCYMASSDSDINHDCDYTIPNLREFKYIVEELNGISWRHFHRSITATLPEILGVVVLCPVSLRGCVFMDAPANEATLVRHLYEDLRDGDEGIDLAGFLKPLYFLQHATFTLLDAKAIFDVVKGNFKPQVNLREYGTALAKVAKVKYTSNPRTLARLLVDIEALRKKARVESFVDAADKHGFDSLRLKLMKSAPLSVLEAYSDTIVQSYQMYCKATPPTLDTNESSAMRMTDECFYDFLVGYFISPDYISSDEAAALVARVMVSSPASFPPSTVMDLPQFLEVLARLAQVLHGKLLAVEDGTLRRTIDTARLEHSLKVMLDQMQVLPNGSTVKSASTVPQQQVNTNIDVLLDDVQLQLGTLSMRSRKVLQRRADNADMDAAGKKKISTQTTKDVPAVDVIVIRDVLAVPEFPPNVMKKVECSLAYQNSGQYELALSQLHEAEDELVDVSPYRVLDTDAQLYFILTRGNILDSRMRDLDALQTFSDAFSVADTLPESHPGRALTLSCLGSVCYYSGNVLVALKCFDKALSLRETAFGTDHVDTATSLNNLACCFHAMGEVDTAAMYFRAALGVFKLGFGLSHPRVSVAMKNLDTAQRHQNKLVHDADHAKSRDDMKHIIAGSKFQITAFERPTGTVKTKKKKAVKKIK
ncbi:Aste57867_17760 [Aphanomyces stellatus]|uniref:Aste57867_17760 protein n=1 Tax=Aphanomyces stellatus TaxID=120398 RepID=A0A485LA29_9STRA|nr:hypothetical protein As57867_017699 [Aphanomyces stellatus]VFT94506.1 Aste57867_17760 [Aphanomyces stellatus]